MSEKMGVEMNKKTAMMNKKKPSSRNNKNEPQYQNTN